MDKRIEQLALQAKAYANEQNELYGVDFKHTYDSKFAELILQDVFNIVRTEHSGHYADYTDESKCQEERDVRKACCFALVNLSVGLQEHFGVEL